MNWQRARRIAYMVAIVLLLLLLVVLGQPATSDIGETKGSEGGLLARLRKEQGFSESDLGEIDPAGETIKLATLGLRGVAANILWEKANTYKMKKDWTNLSATLQQIAKIEPHFVKVWRYQGWNLSYNVSAEFDDYRERYRWVIRGIDYLNEGMRYNRTDPMLVWDVGWFISQKIGRADESKQFRRMFREDEDFFLRYNDARPKEDRDNWLVGMDWYVLSENMVDRGADLKKSTPVIFYSNRPMCLMNFAEAQEGDGVFGEKALVAWQRAGEHWSQFGERAVPTWEQGVTIRLNDKERLLDEAARCVAELDNLDPGLREKIKQERIAKLSPAEKKAYETPPDKRRTEETFSLAMQAESKVNVTHEQVARRVSGKNFEKALDLARKAASFEQQARRIDTNRTLVNYDYWRLRARFEQEPITIQAREALYKADRAFAAGTDLVGAKKEYEQGYALWRKVLDDKRWPQLKQDDGLGEDLARSIRRYRRVLERRDEPFPRNFILQDVFSTYDSRIQD